jgi:oxygen-independent coproporphyrinogen-3 oxidase
VRTVDGSRGRRLPSYRRALTTRRPGEALSIDVTLELLKRYDRPGPRYTSYPTAVEFSERYTEADYRERLARADGKAQEPLSLYVHLPFCEERCSFCGCHVVITRKREVAAKYLDYLLREIDMLADALPSRRSVSQYHWGGGTPTYLELEQMATLHEHVAERFRIMPGAEVAIEVDPRVTSREQIDLLRRMGFNRLSMGVQDFTPAVQEAVNRRQSEEETRGLYAYCRSAGFGSINLDLIYGLPLQTPESFRQSMQVVLDLRPDRLAVYSYAFIPWIKAHQKGIRTEDLPPADVKLRLFCIAREMLLGAGYVQIGMDHFALPDDELVKALEKRTLHRNFMGYTVKMGGAMLGVGVSSIGDVESSFAQNAKKLSRYYESLDNGRFPIERGYVLSRDDEIRRTVITRLMCNLYLDCVDVERAFGIRFQDYFAQELAELCAPDGPVEHGFLEVHPERLVVVGDGTLFVRNICMVFDRYLRDKDPGKPVFSRTV